MAVSYHTHLFDIPTASGSDVIAGISDDKAVTPFSLAGVFDTYSQGIKVDTAMQAATNVVTHGASPSNTSAQNEAAFIAAEAAADQIYVPYGLYNLINPFNLNLDKTYFGPGILQFDQADHRRRGGSSGSVLVPERYTVAYEFDSQSNVHVLFDGVEQAISSWPTYNTAEVFGDSSGQLVVIRVDNGRLRLGSIPQQIAGRNAIGSGKLVPFVPQTAVDSSTGGDNTFFGARAGLNTTNSNNTYFGSQAGMSGPGGNVTAVGYQALYRSVGAGNTAVGSVSMEWNTTGNFNTSLGFGAGSHNVSGNNNVNVGYYAGGDDQGGSHNVRVGYRAGTNVGPANIASSVLVGAFAGDLSRGDGNVGIGYRAHNSEGNAAAAGSLNVAIGYASMRYVNNGAENVAIGTNSLRQISNGSKNIAVGFDALSQVTTGSESVGVGHSALKSVTTGGTSVAVGFEAGAANTTASIVAVGHKALTANTTGADNVAVGRSVLEANVTGSQNTGIGHLALSLSTGTSVTAAGYRAGQTVTGSRGAFFGFESGRFGAASDDVAFFGHRAGRVTTGNGNSALGSDALLYNTSGTSNTGVGRLSLALDQSGTNQTTYSNTTGVGANSRVSGSNQVQLGDSATTTYVYGTVQNRSDERDKADIRNTALGLDFIMALRPVDYRLDLREDYIETDVNGEVIHLERDGSRKRKRFHHGFIAQEIAASGYDFGGFQDHSMSGGNDVLSLGYDEMIAPLVKAVQTLANENAALRDRVAAMEIA